MPTATAPLLRYDLRVVADSRPVLYLHSALAHRGEMARLAALFPERTALVPDLPGHGESTVGGSPLGERAERASVRTFAQRVAELCDSLGLMGPIDVIGYSLGGYVGLELACLRPELVGSLVCHATKFYWTDAEAVQAISGIRQAPASPAAIETMCSVISQLGEVANTRPREALRHLGSRLQLTGGELDELVPPQEIHRLARELGTGELIFPATKHALRTLDLEAFAAAVRQHWLVL